MIQGFAHPEAITTLLDKEHEDLIQTQFEENLVL
jgi:hypothetical protein